MKQTISKAPVSYEHALDFMANEVQSMIKKKNTEKIHLWYLEHPPLYTAGSRAKDEDLLLKNALPVFKTGRGGQYTYHGPGQLVVYCMADLKALGLDIRQYVLTLEQWVLSVLETFDIIGFLDSKRIGVWVKNPVNKTEEKIAAIGLRVSKGITSHGLAFNRSPNLNYYDGIVPCGLPDFGVTSLEKLGKKTSFEELICVFQATLPKDFLIN
jgi:lipoyl(octanoyl) transferase